MRMYKFWNEAGEEKEKAMSLKKAACLFKVILKIRSLVLGNPVKVN